MKFVLRMEKYEVICLNIPQFFVLTVGGAGVHIYGLDWTEIVELRQTKIAWREYNVQ